MQRWFHVGLREARLGPLAEEVELVPRGAGRAIHSLGAAGLRGRQMARLTQPWVLASAHARLHASPLGQRPKALVAVPAGALGKPALVVVCP